MCIFRLLNAKFYKKWSKLLEKRSVQLSLRFSFMFMHDCCGTVNQRYFSSTKILCSFLLFTTFCALNIHGKYLVEIKQSLMRSEGEIKLDRENLCYMVTLHLLLRGFSPCMQRFRLMVANKLPLFL